MIYERSSIALQCIGCVSTPAGLVVWWLEVERSSILHKQARHIGLHVTGALPIELRRSRHERGLLGVKAQPAHMHSRLTARRPLRA